VEFISYLWQDGSIGQTYKTYNTGKYWVEVVDSNGCIGSDTINLIINPNPVINLNDTDICQGNSVTFNPGAGYSKYLWNDASTNQTLTANTSGTYWVSITDNNGCTGGDIEYPVCVFNPQA